MINAHFIDLGATTYTAEQTRLSNLFNEDIYIESGWTTKTLSKLPDGDYDLIPLYRYFSRERPDDFNLIGNFVEQLNGEERPDDFNLIGNFVEQLNGESILRTDSYGSQTSDRRPSSFSEAPYMERLDLAGVVTK